MKITILTAMGTGLLTFGQQPEIIQTPTDITIRLNAPPGVPGGPARAGAFYGLTGALPVGGSPVKGAPYSAEAVTDTTQTLADGNRIATHRSSAVYRDGLGRERREETLPPLPAPGGTAMKTIMISDPVSGASYVLNPQSRTGVKTPVLTMERKAIAGGKTGGASGGNVIVSGKLIPGGPAPNESVKTEELGSQLVEGVLTNGKRETHTIAAGQIGNEQPIQIVDETWYSPELQMTVMSRHSDPRSGETVYKLTTIVRAEPDPSLFQVPPDYTISEGKARTSAR